MCEVQIGAARPSGALLKILICQGRARERFHPLTARGAKHKSAKAEQQSSASTESAKMEQRSNASRRQRCSPKAPNRALVAPKLIIGGICESGLIWTIDSSPERGGHGHHQRAAAT